MQNRKPKLTVLGAGPGDPDLLTIKGAMALADADVVLYDALIDTSLLSYATKADKIFVGKRKGCYVYAQEQINELIVSQALLKGHVVRLKGGDPFVFGRGAEEMEYAAQSSSHSRCLIVLYCIDMNTLLSYRKSLQS